MSDAGKICTRLFRLLSFQRNRESWTTAASGGRRARLVMYAAVIPLLLLSMTNA